MSNLPSGTVTFLLTDLEKSTQLWERQTEPMARAYARHTDILRSAINAHRGHVVKSTGDGIHAAFERASDAVAAALAAQRTLCAADWGEAGPLKVRMALLTGESYERQSDYFGPAMNRAARLVAAASGQQILLAESTYSLVRDSLPDGASVQNLGKYRLRYVQRPEQIYQLLHPDLPASFPPLRSTDEPADYLPRQLTSFVGRQREVAAVKELVATASLVTLTGTGGCGKTRLALQVARELVDEFSDGAFFVNLATVSDPARVGAVLCQALGLKVIGSQTADEALLTHLRERQTLLLLDNFEQVLPAASLVGSVLATCPRTKLIVTSREALRLSAEREFEVPPLQLPAPEDLSRPERLAENEAVQLFLERARAVDPGFAFTDANIGVVADICRRLDGLPLAIELAAARVKVLPPLALRQRLDQRFELLTDGARDLPDRQKTLYNAIAWSYDLLDPQQQSFFQRLSVFGGGCSIEAVAAVIRGEEGQGRESGGVGPALPGPGPLNDAIDGLDSLVGKSLLKLIEPGAEPRFAMLETLREFAAEKLRKSGEAERVRQRHASYFLRLAEAIPTEVWRPTRDYAARLEQLARDSVNVWLALDWTTTRPNPVSALRWGAALGWFWWWRAYGRDSQQQGGETPRQVRASQARALFGAAYVAWRRGEYGVAERLFKESRAAWPDETDADEAEMALSQSGLELVTRWERLDAVAQIAYNDALARFQTDGNLPGAGWMLLHLGWLAFFREDWTTAGDRFGESAVSFEGLVGGAGRAGACLGRGWVAHATGDLETARSSYAESLRLLRGAGDTSPAPFVLANRAMLAADLGQMESAARLAGAVTRLRGSSVPRALVDLLDRRLDPVRRSLGPERFQVAWAEGTGLGLDQAIELGAGLG